MGRVPRGGRDACVRRGAGDACRRAARVLGGVQWLDAGAWQPPKDPGGLGLLVLDGFLVRHVDVVGRPAAELLGSGDLLRPWQPDRTAPFSSGTRWQVL